MKKFSVCLFAVLAMVACGNSNNNQVEEEEFVVNLPKHQVDSANLLAGYFNGLQIGMYFLNDVEDKTPTIDAFVNALDAFYNDQELEENYSLEGQMLQIAQGMGQSIRKQEQENAFMGFKGLSTNYELFKEGLVKGLNIDTFNINPRESMEYMDNLFQPLAVARQEAEMRAAEKKRQAEAEANKAEGETFLAENAKRPEVKTTESGLQYEVIVEGEGEKPTAESTVEVNYEGTFIDGTVFDSSYKHGESISFPLNRVIKGWTEGLQLMSVGSKYKLYIPYELAYGENGHYNIPPCAALIFTIELLDIK